MWTKIKNPEQFVSNRLVAKNVLDAEMSNKDLGEYFIRKVGLEQYMMNSFQQPLELSPFLSVVFGGIIKSPIEYIKDGFWFIWQEKYTKEILDQLRDIVKEKLPPAFSELSINEINQGENYDLTCEVSFNKSGDDLQDELTGQFIQNELEKFGISKIKNIT